MQMPQQYESVPTYVRQRLPAESGPKPEPEGLLCCPGAPTSSVVSKYFIIAPRRARLHVHRLIQESVMHYTVSRGDRWP
eukprot:COSAG06_NODE_8891_length_2038_cov_1.330928_2_plen_79_part_00